MMEQHARSRVAILGTLSDLHQQPIRYDLACLQALVADLAPDILCAEVTREAWEKGDLSEGAVEVRQALAPVVEATDIVLVPIAASNQQFSDFTTDSRLGQRMVRILHDLLRFGQLKAGSPRAINGLVFDVFCHSVCSLAERSWSKSARRAWMMQNLVMVENILDAIRRDPGRRVLVATQCQRTHVIKPLLKRHSELLEFVDYWRV
jgi:hypothetical protein